MLWLAMIGCGPSVRDVEESAVDRWWSIVGHDIDAFLYLDGIGESSGVLWYRTYTPDAVPEDNHLGGGWDLRKRLNLKLHLDMTDGLQEDLESPWNSVTFDLHPQGACYDVTLSTYYVGIACPYDGPWR